MNYSNNFAIVFCPYFGSLPDNFSLWINSCSYNSFIHFVVITDDYYDRGLPDNVEILNLSFSDFCDLVQSKFDFKIALTNSYKLCDFKPVYGYIFEEYLPGYMYWGYCDLDLIFGDLKKFLPEKEYDKLSYLGHFCLYKNDEKMLQAFKYNEGSMISYKDILSSDIHFGFDEIGDYGINNIFLNSHFSIYNYEKHVADISCVRDGMVLAVFDNGSFTTNAASRLFSFEEGHIFSYDIKNGCLEKIEYAYVHLQKRKMINCMGKETPSKFLIYPDRYDYYAEVTERLVLDNQDHHFFPKKRMIIKSKSLVKKIKRLIEIQKIKAKKRAVFK